MSDLTQEIKDGIQANETRQQTANAAAAQQCQDMALKYAISTDKLADDMKIYFSDMLHGQQQQFMVDRTTYLSQHQQQLAGLENRLEALRTRQIKTAHNQTLFFCPGMGLP